jgi:ankyrin repeat protein
MRLPIWAVLVIQAGCGWMMGPLPPLIGAARTGDTDLIRRLADAGTDLNAPAGVNNWTPLMHAIHKNQAKAVEVLLIAGADANAVSGRTTALVMAAGYGQTDIVRILLKHGANPRLEAPNGYSPLTAAVMGSYDIDAYTAGKCQAETVKALLERDPSLRLPRNSEAIQIARRGTCAEVVALASK